MNMEYSFNILEEARNLTQAPKLDILEIRRYIGVPVADSVRRWLSNQPVRKPLYLDFSKVRAITVSVAEELGPLLAQSVEASPAFDQRYPIYLLDNAEHAYTFGVAFANLSWTGLAIMTQSVESSASLTNVADIGDSCVVVLGQLSNQMEQILRYADDRFLKGEVLTSDNLSSLAFLENVSAAARSKRLTELYSRRLLAFHENPRNQKERLFIPAWLL